MDDRNREAVSGSTNFVVAPTEEQLAGLDRELRFHPASTEDPQRPTPQQIAAFNERGFLQSLPVFSETEIAQHRDYFDCLLEQVLNAGGDAYSISSAHLRYAPVYDLLCHPTIVGYVVDLLGPDVIGWGSHYFCKLPKDDKPVDWHQDASYWPLTPSRAVTVWLAIDDADGENGCMQFIEGSHHLGHRPHIADEQTSQSVLGRGITNVSQMGRIVANPVKAGLISIHSDLLVHGSQPNQSTRRRCGLTLRYCAASVRASLGWSCKGVVVHGQDAEHHWANPGRPADPGPN